MPVTFWISGQTAKQAIPLKEKGIKRTVQACGTVLDEYSTTDSNQEKKCIKRIKRALASFVKRPGKAVFASTGQESIQHKKWMLKRLWKELLEKSKGS